MRKSRNIKEIEHLFPKIKAYLRRVYGDKLETIILYGSFAKHKATEDSDIDIAIILKEDINPVQEMNRLNAFISDLGLEYDELITILLLSSPEVENSIWPLYRSLREEGIRL